MKADEYPRLKHMFGSYFHQDWDMEGRDWPDLIRNYARDSSVAEIQAAAAEIEALLDTNPSNELLEESLERDFGCCYDAHPEADGPGFVAWMRLLVDSLREHAQQRVPTDGR